MVECLISYRHMAIKKGKPYYDFRTCLRSSLAKASEEENKRGQGWTGIDGWILDFCDDLSHTGDVISSDPVHLIAK